VFRNELIPGGVVQRRSGLDMERSAKVIDEVRAPCEKRVSVLARPSPGYKLFEQTKHNGKLEL
jgi:hypothetical protein